jgi:thioesterase domain-containing protein
LKTGGEYVRADQTEHRVGARDLGRRLVLQQGDPPLQAEGYQVLASQHGLDSLEGDVATVTRTIGRVSGPVLLVGHSYGGTDHRRGHR